MSKHKKTRKEKVAADYRHQVYTIKNKNFPLDVIKPDVSIDSENQYLNAHIVKSVIKTGVLSLSIIAAQITLFFLLTKHIITLPIVKY